MRLKELIDMHLKYFRENELDRIRLAREYYRGVFWKADDRNVHKAVDRKTRLAQNLLSKNIIFPVAESAVSALLGPNPQVSAIGLNEESEERAPEISSLNAYILRENKFRSIANLAMIDDILCGRHVFKTGWNSTRDCPIITARDPVTVFYDMAARTLDASRYFIEANLLSWSTFCDRVRSGKYKVPSDKVDSIRPEGMPDWIYRAGRDSRATPMFTAADWIVVWEYYDIERGFVVHYLFDQDVTLMAHALPYNPFSIGTLNLNGIDNSGLSEVMLILEQQEAINDGLSMLKTLAGKSIPRILYDKDALGEADISAIVRTEVGDYVGVPYSNRNADNGSMPVPFNSLFAPSPMPSAPTAVLDLINRCEADAQYISALSDASRGQIANARTATEMAVIDSQLRSRTSTRASNFGDSVEDVMSKAYFLAARYMTAPKKVRIVGTNRFVDIRFSDLRELQYDFQLVPNNPIRMTPSVQVEALTQLMPLIQGNPAINQSLLLTLILRSLSLESAILPEKDQQAAAVASAQAAGVGAAQAAGGEVDPNAAMEAATAASMPPEMAAQLAQPSMADMAGAGPNPLPTMQESTQSGDMGPAMDMPNLPV